MKVSLSWMQQLTDVPLSENGVDDLVEKIGSQLGAVEEVIKSGSQYEGVIVARVAACAKHPDADRLQVCWLDDGGAAQNVTRNENNHIQVVCGAPNCREGLLVAWMPPGVKVPGGPKDDPLVLEAREIRGELSNGMIASPKELGLSDNHDGILEISEDVQPGTPFADVYQLNDTVIDIENKMFTHRPDCFGQLGVARELAGIQQKAFTSPDWYLQAPEVQSIEDSSVPNVEVAVAIPELVPRYMAAVLSGITIKSSPAWLQSYLSRVGIRPINNIVDMTNYVMMLTGQPLHAFDYDKLARGGTPKIVVRKPHEGEEMTLLDGKTIKPRENAVLICDDEKPIALGGIMGGNNSEIDENTTRIIIECATFDMYNIRKTSMEHGVFSDAAARFNKGQSEWQNPSVLYKAIRMTQDLVDGVQLVHGIVDVHTVSRENKPVTVSPQFITERLGAEMSAEDMAQLLRNVEFAVEVTNENLVVTAPYWRTDIEIPEDIVEEIGRLHGYDKLPLELPKRSMKPAPPNPQVATKDSVRAALAAAGANEVLAYSFVHGKLLERTGQNKDLAFKLSNALSPDLQYYRLSLTPSLLEKVYPNLRADYVRGADNEFALFEIGVAHGKSELDENGLPREFGRVAFTIVADAKTAARKYSGSAYYSALNYLEYLQSKFGLELSLVPLNEADFGGHQLMEQMKAPYEANRSAAIKFGDLICGVIGEYKASVRQALKLPEYAAGFEMFQSVFSKGSPVNYTPLPNYPKVEQDICFKVPASTTYKQVMQLLDTELSGAEAEHGYSFVVKPVDIYQKEDDSEHLQITVRIWLFHYDRTLTNEEVNTLLSHISEEAGRALQAERI